MWVIGAYEFIGHSKAAMISLAAAIPEFAVDFQLRLLCGVTHQITLECSKCGRVKYTSRKTITAGEGDTVKCDVCGLQPIKDAMRLQGVVKMTKFR